jgi:mono/diheme cytochrome c family protein
MQQRIPRAILGTALTAIALNAHAQDGDVAAGHAFAREACNSCHIVEADPRSPRLISVGPAFRDIANTPGITAIALRAFLASSHPRMPNFVLTPEETADVIAYILSLRDR